MRTTTLKYLCPLLVYIASFRAFMVTGWQIWLPVISAWFVIPLIELCTRPDPRNLEETEEQLAKKDKNYDFILYIIVVLQYAALARFLYVMSHDEMTWFDIAGRIWVMGLLCGVFGINVAHELGHRSTVFEKTLSKLLLLSSQYMHFFIEHNKGHHKRVATPEDPSSARYGESVYSFYFRSVIFSYFSAWHIANKEVKKKGKPVFSFYNEMIGYTLIQIVFIGTLIFFFGWLVSLYYLVAAGIGITLLETVNYIEHYGLSRRATGEGKYERAMPSHSWNSNHVVGRIFLFELSRHSDHHYVASRKYQVLRNHDDAPQMPTGYPGMMLLSLIPPAWFYVMNRRIKELSSSSNNVIEADIKVS